MSGIFIRLKSGEIHEKTKKEWICDNRLFFVRFRKNSTAKKREKTQFFEKNSIFLKTQPDFP